MKVIHLKGYFLRSKISNKTLPTTKNWCKNSSYWCYKEHTATYTILHPKKHQSDDDINIKLLCCCCCLFSFSIFQPVFELCWKWTPKVYLDITLPAILSTRIMMMMLMLVLLHCFQPYYCVYMWNLGAARIFDHHNKLWYSVFH